jgi:diacylglycerol kinase (ATP)
VNRFLFLVNPTAGSGRAGAVWSRLSDAHPELRGAAVIRERQPERARELLRQALGPGVRALVAVGGDGTLHLAANALLDRALGEQVALGIVPAGTGSDLARSLGVPRDPAQALQIAWESKPRPCDALEVIPDGHPRRFVVNVASAGVSGLVGQAVNALPRRTAWVYFSTALSALVRFRPVACRVLADGEPWFEGPLLLLAVANGATFGRGMRVAPQAEVDDGLLDLVLLPGMPRWRLPFRLPRVYWGSHLRLPGVQVRRATRVRLEPLEAGFPPLDLDGESGPATAAEMRLLPAALRVLAPPRLSPSAAVATTRQR